MTIYELKREHERLTQGHWFDRSSMKFFGDTLGNFRVKDGGDCWIVTRKKAVKFMDTLQGLRDSYHFDKKTMKVDRHKKDA